MGTLIEVTNPKYWGFDKWQRMTQLVNVASNNLKLFMLIQIGTAKGEQAVLVCRYWADLGSAS